MRASKGGQDRLRAGTSVEAETAQPEAALLPGHQPGSAVGDVTQEQPRLASGQEFPQLGVQVRQPAGGQSPVITVDYGLQRLQRGQREQARPAHS